MANWKTTCDIKQFLDNDDLSTREKFEKIAEEISKCRAFGDTLFADYLTEILDLDEHDLIAEGDGYLTEIYEYADEHLIWMGPA